jgi:hypothetical protein
MLAMFWDLDDCFGSKGREQVSAEDLEAQQEGGEDHHRVMGPLREVPKAHLPDCDVQDDQARCPEEDQGREGRDTNDGIGQAIGKSERWQVIGGQGKARLEHKPKQAEGGGGDRGDSRDPITRSLDGGAAGREPDGGHGGPEHEGGDEDNRHGAGAGPAKRRGVPPGHTAVGTALGHEPIERFVV